jgi:pimeloyl-ACP methyl ester carboxylesterase
MRMTTFILVPGGWHGGWYFEPIADALRQLGHTAQSVTLTGLDDQAPSAPAAAANLDTHIQDVVTLLETQDIHDAVLVGHSYAGMVITGAAARAAGRVTRLVYADAYLPADGDSCYDLSTPAFREHFIRGAQADGRTVAPPARLVGVGARTTPHPLASILQRIRLETEPCVERRDYIYLSGWPETPFTGVYERLRRDSAWHVHTLPIGHNVARDAAEPLVRILIEQ